MKGWESEGMCSESLLPVCSLRVKDMLKGARRPVDRGRPIRRLTEIAPVFTAYQGQGHFYGLNVCVLPAKFICWNLVPHVILLEFGDLVKWGGHESGVSMNGTSALKQNASGRPLSLLPLRTRWEDSLNQEADSSQKLNVLVPCCWTSPLSELWEINVCCT